MSLENPTDFEYKPRLYKALYALFYATEGFATTGILLFLPVYMADQLLFDEITIGVLLAIGAIPGYLKVVYGFASDSKSLGRFGYRRGYVLISIPLIVGGWLILPFALDAILFTTVVFITTLGFYLGDTAVDAWAVDVTPESDRGSMMGLGWGAQGIASVFGVLVITLASPTLGYPTAFIILGSIAGVGALVWFLVAREKPVENRKTVFETVEIIREELNHSYLWLAFLAYVGGGFIFGVGTNFISLFYTDVVGVDSTESAIFVLIWSVFFFIGGILGGVSYDRFKDYRSGVIAIAPIYAVSLFLMGFNSTGNLTIAYATTILFGIGSGMTTAAIMGFAMHITPPAIAGTMFAVFTSLVNVGQNAIAYPFLGITVPVWGYMLPFAIGALVAIPVIVLAKYIVPPWKKEENLTENA
ncbi:MAG: MFS transporter [Candidatus Thorarchaeota archaeon]|nr:MFS transporter [Candidatus Thorarchaeota archaeon]